MKFLFFLFAVASCCFVAIKASHSEDICEDFERTREGLDAISSQPEKFVRVFLDKIAHRIHGKKSIILSILTSIALLVKGIVEVVDAIASFRLPAGGTVFEVIQGAIIYALDVFVGHNEAAMSSWVKFVGFIFETIRRVYHAFKPVVSRILERLTQL